ncbi:MAG: type II toxin-antitoxin system RelE/ParE family toxin [Caldilineaceae bacterium]
MRNRYRLRPNPRLRADLRLVPSRIKADVIAVIEDLAYEPYPPNAEELRDHYRGIYKIKVDGWRIFYTVNEVDKTVFIVSIKRRTPDTYTSLFE